MIGRASVRGVAKGSGRRPGRQPAHQSGGGVRALPGSLVLFLAIVAFATGGLPGEARSNPNDALRLLRVTPNGNDVPGNRQIVFQFDKPVVPLGRMARTPEEVSIRVTPDPGCDWRWLDPSALACQLGEKNPLARSTHYRIRVEPGFESVDGARLGQGSDHEFITERPAVRYHWFQAWTGPGEPVIRLTFNQAVVADSLPRGMHFRLPDGGRVPVDVELDERRTNTWFVRPRRPLPLGASVALRLTPGIASSEGPERSIVDKVLVSFKTFAEQRFLGVQCVDNHGRPMFLEAVVGADPGGRRCDPMRQAELVFTAPVRGVDLGKGLEVVPDLAGGRHDFDPWENARSYSRLSRAPRDDHRYGTPLPKGLKAWQRYELSAPADAIRDEFGRPLAQDLGFEFFTDHRRPKLHLGHATSVLESRVDSEIKEGRKRMRVITGQQMIPNPAFTAFVAKKGTRHQNDPDAPPRTIPQDVEEDISVSLELHRKAGFVGVSYRVVDAKSAKIIHTNSVNHSAEHTDEATEGVEMGDFKQEFKLASLPPDMEIYGELSTQVSLSMGADLVNILANPDGSYFLQCQELADEGEYLAASELCANAAVLLEFKEKDVSAVLPLLKQVTLNSGMRSD